MFHRAAPRVKYVAALQAGGVCDGLALKLCLGRLGRRFPTPTCKGPCAFC
jgi:hypothetical protein